MHSVVVGKFPVVEAFLAHFLCRYNLRSIHSQRVELALLLRRRKFQPACGVTSCEALHGLGVVGDAQTFACEAFLAHVAAPRDGVALVKCVVDDAHHLVHRHVVRAVPAPVVLHFHGECSIEWMVCVACDAYIVVPVDAEALCKLLRGVCLSLVNEGLRTLAQICVEDALEARLPLVGNLLCLALGHRVNVWRHHLKELVEVSERVALHGARQRHSVFRADAVALDNVEHVACRTSL